VYIPGGFLRKFRILLDEGIEDEGIEDEGIEKDGKAK